MFHRAIESVRHSFVLARFATVTHQFSEVIDAVNHRFGTNFERLNESPEVRARVLEEVDRLALERGAEDENGQPYSLRRPETHRLAREKEKEVMREKLLEFELRPQVDMATAAYQRLAANADV